MATRSTTIEEPGAPEKTRDPRVDAYVAKSAPFARPILAHLRHIVHAACPDVEETMKWSMPFFVYCDGNLCHMAAFKAHCAFGFWRGKELPDLPAPDGASAMGSLGRILSLDDLPDKRRLTGFVRAAMKLNEGVRKTARARSAPKPVPAMPDDLVQAFAVNVEAAKHFAAFSPSCRREYLDWVLEAKRAETRAVRIAKVVQQCSEGKSLQWKYQK